MTVYIPTPSSLHLRDLFVLSSANTGAAMGGIIFFCLYIPYFFLRQRYATLTMHTKIFACLDFQVAMAFGGNLLGQFEGVGKSGFSFFYIEAYVYFLMNIYFCDKWKYSNKKFILMK